MKEMIDFVPLFIRGITKMPWLLIFVVALIVAAIEEKWDGRGADEKKRLDQATKRDNPKRSNNKKHAI